MEIGILTLDDRLVNRLRLSLARKRADVVTVTVAIDLGIPGGVFGVVVHAFDTALAVAPQAKVLMGLLIGDNPQVGSPTVETIMLRKMSQR